MTVGLVHPGAMGARVGACLVGAGYRVVWAGDGRSTATCERADTAQLVDVGVLAEVIKASDFVFSICPPHAAREVASAVADLGFSGTYVDANAIAPSGSSAIAQVVAAAGADYVDGGIVGPPPDQRGTTRLFLSGPLAESVASHFEGTFLEPVVIDEKVGSASALKAAFATWTKVSAALLLSVESYAERAGILPVLLEEWDRRFPELRGRVEFTRAATEPKAWRFVGEMEQLATAMIDQQLPAGFHEAAAEIYRRSAHQNEASAS